MVIFTLFSWNDFDGKNNCFASCVEIENTSIIFQNNRLKCPFHHRKFHFFDYFDMKTMKSLMHFPSFTWNDFDEKNNCLPSCVEIENTSIIFQNNRLKCPFHHRKFHFFD